MTNCLNLKCELHKSDIDKLRAVQDELEKLSHVCKTWKLFTKFTKLKLKKKCLINTSYLDTKNNFDTRRKKNENTIKEVSDFAKTTNTLLNKKNWLTRKNLSIC